MKREQGYYWVKDDGVWKVAEYGIFYDWLLKQREGWHLFGTAESYCEGEYVGDPIFGDDCFEQINESRIPSPEEALTPEETKETIIEIAKDSYGADGCFEYSWFNQMYDKLHITIVSKDK